MLRHPLFRARLILLDLAVDDDEDIRIEVATMVRGLVLHDREKRGSEGSKASNAALLRLLGQAHELAGSSAACVDALWAWMDGFYSSLQSSVWQQHMFTKLTEGTHALASQPGQDGSALFTQERANQYVDEMDTLQKCYESCRDGQVASSIIISAAALSSTLRRVTSAAHTLLNRQDSREATPGSWAIASSYVELHRLHWGLHVLLDHPQVGALSETDATVVLDSRRMHQALQRAQEPDPTPEETSHGEEGGKRRLCIA